MKSTSTIFKPFHALIILALLLSFASAKSTHAANYIVNTTADNVYDGACNAHCSLRDAIGVAPAGSTITFNVTGTITLNEGLLVIKKNLTIEGPGADQLAISGNNIERIFYINNAGVNFTLSGVTIKNGKSFDSDGGGMYNNGGTVVLEEMTFSQNTANGNGGGLYSNGGSVTLKNVTFSGNSVSSGSGGGMYNAGTTDAQGGEFNGNSASDRGGGLYNGSHATITDVTFHDNNSGNDGGGMYAASSSTLNRVTFSDNDADRFGGGLHADSSSTITNTTFSGNTASSTGGGLQAAYGTTRLTNVTFSGNTATYDGGGMYKEYATCTLNNVTFTGNSGQRGGGLYSYNVSGSVTLKNVIIANSTRGGDCGGENVQASSANNLIEDATNNCGLTDGTNNNIIGTDPMLGDLLDNGGMTLTHSLLAGSPAIDQGSTPDCATTDQRGINRPQGANCDIGAYELETTDPDNDLITTAFNIQRLSYTSNINTKQAVLSEGDPDLKGECGITGTGDATVWYTYTPKVDGALVLDTRESNYNTFIAVWANTETGLELTACNNGANQLGMQVTGNITYYIEVGQP
jgi:CSLREA domain-containing protein